MHHLTDTEGEQNNRLVEQMQNVKYLLVNSCGYSNAQQ